jgi:hypothetical protein
MKMTCMAPAVSKKSTRVTEVTFSSMVSPKISPRTKGIAKSVKKSAVPVFDLV